MFGWQGVQRSKAETEFEKKNGLRFVKVDTSNDVFRVKQAALGAIFKSTPLATTLNKYFNEYINETTLVYSDIAERQQRLNELRFMVLNDPFVSRVCRLVSDEATQLDDQNRLLSVESPSLPFVNRCYELFSQWGITQQRISSVCYDLEQYGEGLWAHRVTEHGVEKITPLKVSSLRERLEFSPVHMAEIVAQMTGGTDISKNRSSKINKLVNLVSTPTGTGNLSDLDENFADMFDTKLLGFEFDDDIIVPPWIITHFRYQPDNSEFFPYGSPPLLMALAPFKQTYSTIALQGLARAASFPIQIYKVKNTEGVGPATAFDTVNAVREDFENIGVTPASNSLEVYTMNTKIWVPDGLLEMDIKKSDVDIDFVGDLEIYQDRVAIACGVPKAYLDQEFGGFGNSGIALMEQYKPFARHVYTIQSSFLEALGQLIRLHFAITGEFDYNIPFVLSMRFPAEDMGEEKRNARQASVELANSIIDMLQGVLGMEEGEPLPEDVVADILSKYTFIDPTDLQRWIRLSAIAKAAAQAASANDGDDAGGMDMGGGGDMGGDVDMGGEGDIPPDDATAPADDAGGGGEPMPEAITSEEREYYLRTKIMLREKLQKESQLKERKRALKRLNEISGRYKECKNEMYFRFLKENNFTEWAKSKRHEMLIPPISKSHKMFEAFTALLSDEGKDKGLKPLRKGRSKKLAEKTLADPLNDIAPEKMDLDTLLGNHD